MKLKLEDLLKSIISYGKVERALDKGLRKIRKPIVESWVLPGAIGGALALDSSRFSEAVDLAIVANQTGIREVVGNLGYNFLEYVAPNGVFVAGIAGVAIPSAIHLHRYYQKTANYPQTKSNGIKSNYQKIKEFLLENKIIKNRVVLPTLTALGLGYLAYSGLGNKDLIDVGTSLAVAATGVKAGYDLYEAEIGKVPNTPNRDRWSSKIPLIYVLAFASILNGSWNAIKSSRLMDWSKVVETASELIEPQNDKKIIGYKTIEEREETIMNAVEYYSHMYKIDKNLVAAMLKVESGFNHSDARGNILKSSRNAYGIGQQTNVNVEDLNRLINKGELNGEKFDWTQVKRDPAENIRATAATVRHLEDLFGGERNSIERIAAVYNCGIGNYNSAVKKSKSNNFWENLKRMPKETNLYVRKVAAYHWARENGVTWPSVSHRVNSAFGKRSGKMHRGIDIAPTKQHVPGDPVYAFADGRVINLGYIARTNGTYVRLQHGNPNLGFYSEYLHGVRKSIRYGSGSEVSGGDVLMKMGATGHVRPVNGVHLHFTCGLRFRYNGRRVNVEFNPIDFFRSWGESKIKLKIKEPIYGIDIKS